MPMNYFLNIISQSAYRDEEAPGLNLNWYNTKQNPVPALDDALKAGELETDPEKANEYYRTANGIIADDVAWLALTNDKLPRFWRPMSMASCTQSTSTTTCPRFGSVNSFADRFRRAAKSLGPSDFLPTGGIRGMVAFIIRRTLAAILVLFGVSILIFTLVKITPGDPARAQLPASATPDQIHALQHAMGLDRPLPGQYISWLSNALHGDLGLSYQHRISAISLVKERFSNTLILAGSALTVAVLIGVTIGVVAGTRPNSFVDRFLTLLAVAAASVPTYWLGIVLLIVFSLKLQWFPATGMYNPREEPSLPDLLRHLVLPTITTAAVPTAIIARMVRSSVQETMTLDHVRTARAKGLSERTVVTRHALRNALPTFVTIIALQAGYLMGGSLIAEIVFTWPGIGLQVYTAVGARDIPIIMSVTLLVAVIFVTLNFLADLVQAIADPRIRLA